MNLLSAPTDLQKFLCKTVSALSLVVAQASFGSFAFAQDAPVKVAPGAEAAGAPAGAGYMNILLLAGMFFFMWLFIIRPQAKRQKEHKQFLEKLTSGQEVVTSGGLIGKITSVQDTVVTLDVGHGSVRILKSAVSGELGQPAQST